MSARAYPNTRFAVGKNRDLWKLRVIKEHDQKLQGASELKDACSMGSGEKLNELLQHVSADESLEPQLPSIPTPHHGLRMRLQQQWRHRQLREVGWQIH